MLALNNLPNIKFIDDNNFFLIAGPCIVENEEVCFEIAEKVIEICDKFKIPYIFKASYRKANRSRIDSFTGIGDEKALTIIEKVKEYYSIPVITDIHSIEEASYAASFVDVLQIPAFLSRQTDLLIAAAKTGKYVNIKKGQFMSAEAMQFAADKVKDSGNTNIMLTDRGTMFGYQDLIVDYRGIPEMKKLEYPTILDITHSLQQPNQSSGISGGKPELIETIAKAGIAVGADGLFIETHPDPAIAKSDGSNMLQLNKLESLLEKLTILKDSVNKIAKL